MKKTTKLFRLKCIPVIFVSAFTFFTCTSQPTQQQAPEQVQRLPLKSSYEVGELGPAGGIVFYDKGNNSGGWQYLEAAPANTEVRNVIWGASGRDLSGTRTEIGTGKRNTELIIAQLRQMGESGRAAQVCANLNFGGYRDWFLPSKDELNLIYRNLKQKGLGGFGNYYYWSSTAYNSDDAWSQNRNDEAWFQNLARGGQALDFRHSIAGSELGRLAVRAIRMF